jgi:tripartite-type tricarboxylate transporter receptor subunit TctC
MDYRKLLPLATALAALRIRRKRPRPAEPADDHGGAVRRRRPDGLLARILQPTLAETLGQPIIIEKRARGGGMTGSLRVSQASADSHVFVLASIGTHAIGNSMHSKPPYHPANDFQPVAFVADAPLLLMVKKDLAPNNLAEFIATPKTNHDKMTFSSGGTGTSSHVSCVMLNQIMGVDVTHVPYRGGGPAFADLIAGRIDYICNYVSIGASAVKQGQVKAIAMLARERTPLLPDLPTADEQGLKDFDVSAWNAILLPKSATPAMVAKFNAAVSKALDNPALRSRSTPSASLPPCRTAAARTICASSSTPKSKNGPSLSKRAG